VRVDEKIIPALSGQKDRTATENKHAGTCMSSSFVVFFFSFFAVVLRSFTASLLRLA
jgi:hypothetical protein